MRLCRLMVLTVSPEIYSGDDRNRFTADFDERPMSERALPRVRNVPPKQSYWPSFWPLNERKLAQRFKELKSSLMAEAF